MFEFLYGSTSTTRWRQDLWLLCCDNFCHSKLSRVIETLDLHSIAYIATGQSFMSVSCFGHQISSLGKSSLPRTPDLSGVIGRRVCSVLFFSRLLGNVRPVDGIFWWRTWGWRIALQMVVRKVPVCWERRWGHFLLLLKSHVLVRRRSLVSFVAYGSRAVSFRIRFRPRLGFLLCFFAPFPFHPSILEPDFYLKEKKK